MRKRLPYFFRTTSIVVAGLLVAPASAIETNSESSEAEDQMKVKRAFDALSYSKARRALDALSPTERKKLFSSRTARIAPKPARNFLQEENDDCISVKDYSENSVGFRMGFNPDGVKFNGGIYKKKNGSESFGSSVPASHKHSAFCALSSPETTSTRQPNPVEYPDHVHSLNTLPPFNDRHLPASELGESLRRQRYANGQPQQLAPAPSMPMTGETYREGRSSRTPELPGRVIVTTPGGGLKMKMQ
ncbi:hypothetical protein BCF11_5152 [Collimonas sp. PA-H2]|uniref:hypothetical protein n=1 Tax=Collimonas sp. PA-H2 TaxID=1881062 RepID=UPI000C01B984|nr:hypothetical protein [Collimonas sp. PA-H2]PFH04377.1 hypothetical protein BCF11_5152 [Collimonas sp. PA-H2]